jgi:hypothetical protein
MVYVLLNSFPRQWGEGIWILPLLMIPVALMLMTFCDGGVGRGLKSLSSVIGDVYVNLLGDVPLIATAQFMEIRTTFFAEVDFGRLVLAHDTDTRPMLPHITPLTTNHAEPSSSSSSSSSGGGDVNGGGGGGDWLYD